MENTCLKFLSNTKCNQLYHMGNSKGEASAVDVDQLFSIWAILPPGEICKYLGTSSILITGGRELDHWHLVGSYQG